MDRHLSYTAAVPVFEQVDALPLAQHQPAAVYRDGQRCCRKGRLDVCRHVIRAFECMRIYRIAFRHQAIQPPFKIVLCGWIGILLDDQAGRSMTHE